MDSLVIFCTILVNVIVIGLQLYWAISGNLPRQDIQWVASGFGGVFGFILFLYGLNRFIKQRSHPLLILSSSFLGLLAVLTFITIRMSNCIPRIAPGADLTSCDFSREDLAGIDFSEADLTGAYFRDTNLQGAIFNESNLTRCDFMGANLSNAKLTDSTLSSAIFINTTGLTDEMLADALGVLLNELPSAAGKEGVQLDTLETMLTAFRAFCDGAELSEAASYTPDDRFHPYFIFSQTYGEVTGIYNTDSPLSRYTSSGTYNHRTAAVRFTELVGCVEQHQAVVGCGPYLGKVQATVTRLQYTATFYFRAAQTGDVIATTSKQSLLPDCPPVISEGGLNVPYDDINGTWVILVEPLRLSIFDDWKKEFINP